MAVAYIERYRVVFLKFRREKKNASNVLRRAHLAVYLCVNCCS